MNGLHAAPRITHEMAFTRPEVFKDGVVAHLAATAVQGEESLREGLLRAAVSGPDGFRFKDLTINPHTWVSLSQGRSISLGAAPLDSETKGTLIFEDWKVGYDDEVAMRLLHEFGHRAIANASGNHPVGNVLNWAYDVREQTGGRLGLTAIGSHAHYQATANRSLVLNRAVEDTAELLATQAWDPNRAWRYYSLLEDTAYGEAREASGLQRISNPDRAYRIVADAVDYVVRHAPR